MAARRGSGRLLSCERVSRRKGSGGVDCWLVKYLPCLAETDVSKTDATVDEDDGKTR